MLDSFDQKKAAILKGIRQTSTDSPDASPKGSIDELCIPMMELLNAHPDIVTTSSCSGRVSVFLEGAKAPSQSVQIGAKGEGGKWVFVSHDPNNIANWWSETGLLFNTTSPLVCADTTRYLLYKFEPFILHVKCRTLKVAQIVYTTAMSCGFRESGIGVNNVVGVRISIKLDIPIGYLDENTNTLMSLVTEEYLKIMVKLSLDRFKENTRKIGMLHAAFEKALTLMTLDEQKTTQREDKEARRQRKMKEGMERKEAVRETKLAAKAAKLAEQKKESED